MFTLLTGALLLLTTVNGNWFTGVYLVHDWTGHTRIADDGYGTVLATVMSEAGNQTTGMICDDGVDAVTANFICRKAGFIGARVMSNNNITSRQHRLSERNWRQQWEGSSH